MLTLVGSVFDSRLDSSDSSSESADSRPCKTVEYRMTYDSQPTVLIYLLADCINLSMGRVGMGPELLLPIVDGIHDSTR